MSIDLSGQRLDIGMPPGSQPVDVTVLDEIKARFFDACPICGDPATTDEHIPPQSLGGKIMTRTCGPCNNDLGSRVEADLTDWHDDALMGARWRSAGIRGYRGSGRIVHRVGPAGEWILVIDGGHDPAVIDMLNSGHVEMEVRMPDRNRYRLALLKHAYLAACLKFGVPDGEAADQVRRDLIGARDARSIQDVPRSRLALGLIVARLATAKPAPVPPVVWAVAQEPDGPGHGVLLGGRIFVSWSSGPIADDEAAVEAGPVRLDLVVGGSMPGTVSSVDGGS
jgi:HNH endonuclease